jgi:predicted esterase
MWLLALCAAAPEPYPIAQPDGHMGASVAFRNKCTSDCALLIMLHGFGGDGEKMAVSSQMHYKFVGIVAYPSCVPFGQGWPIVQNDADEYWDANMKIVNALIADPNVDASKVFVLGFSSGGFYTFALECAIGGRLAGTVVLAALKYLQPERCHRTDRLHIHNMHDTYNVPVDPANGTKPGGLVEIGLPTTLRNNWLDPVTYPDGTTNGPDGNSSGQFQLFTARQGKLQLEYHFYNGPPEHAYMVYKGTPAGAPTDHVGTPLVMEDYITYHLMGVVPPPTPPAPPGSTYGCDGPDAKCYEGKGIQTKAECEATCTGPAKDMYICWQQKCYSGKGNQTKAQCDASCK